MAELKKPSQERVFLVVVDDSDEMIVALRFACGRVRNTGGRVALLYVVSKGDFQHWMAVKDLMEEEHRARAEQRLKELSAKVLEWTGEMPILYIRAGQRRDELLKLLAEEPNISILVLAAATGTTGPGPLISALTGKKYSSRLKIPFVIVPGSLTDEQVDALT